MSFFQGFLNEIEKLAQEGKGLFHPRAATTPIGKGVTKDQYLRPSEELRQRTSGSPQIDPLLQKQKKKKPASGITGTYKKLLRGIRGKAD